MAADLHADFCIMLEAFVHVSDHILNILLCHSLRKALCLLLDSYAVCALFNQSFPSTNLDTMNDTT